MLRFCFLTYGCKLNQYYTDYLKNAVINSGGFVVDSLDDCDVLVINACVVTHKAERDVKKAIHRGLKHPSKPVVVLTGCIGPLKDYPGPHFKGSYKEVLEYFSLEAPSFLRFVSRDRPFIKIQEGCDYKCSYCIVPQVRGRAKSRPKEEVLKEVKTLVEEGYREIVLTGTEILDWGKEWGSYITELLGQIVKIEGNFRIRLSSLMPHRIKRELIEFIRENPKVVPHFHVPLQSGSDRVLRAMKRPYRVKTFIEKIELIAQNFELPAIGTDVIVGFPTETHEDFKETRRIIEELPFSYIHVFEYSPRPGTSALSLGPPIEPNERKYRVRELIELAKEKKRKFLEKNVGRRLVAVVEEKLNGRNLGTSENYIKLKFPGDYRRGELVEVKGVDVEEEYLLCESIPEK